MTFKMISSFFFLSVFLMEVKDKDFRLLVTRMFQDSDTGFYLYFWGLLYLIFTFFFTFHLILGQDIFFLLSQFFCFLFQSLSVGRKLFPMQL